MIDFVIVIVIDFVIVIVIVVISCVKIREVSLTIIIIGLFVMGVIVR